MKVTVAVLDKNGDSAVTKVLDILNSFDVGQLSRFGFISPRKSLFEKNVEIIKKQGLKSSTVAGYVTSKPKSQVIMSIFNWMMLPLLFEGRVYSPIPKTAVTEQVAKEPLHCEASLANINGASGWRLFVPYGQGRLGCGRKRPNWSSTSLLWRKQRNSCLRHKSKSLLETRNRKPRVLSSWKLGFREQRRLQIQTHKNPYLHRTPSL